MDMEKILYHYKAKVINVYDGDTCTVDIDLGLHIWNKGEKLRLNRINAPELRGNEKAKGLKSRDFLRSLILDKEVYLETIKDKKEKYGRYLAEIWLEDEKNNFININDILVKNGFAKYQKY
jgi:micrococcal nuclease